MPAFAPFQLRLGTIGTNKLLELNAKMPQLYASFPGSTALDSATFDEDETSGDDRGTLEITFASGSTYTFENVPVSEFYGLQAASSPGSYYHANIKGKY